MHLSVVRANKYARNGGRRFREPSEISKIESVESKVENEKMSVKMRQTNAIYWNQAKSEDDAVEKYVSNYAKKEHAEATQMLESVLDFTRHSKPSPRCERRCIKSKRREVLEKPQGSGKRTGRRRRIMDFEAKSNRPDIAVQDSYNMTQDLCKHHSSNVWKPDKKPRITSW